MPPNKELKLTKPSIMELRSLTLVFGGPMREVAIRVDAGDENPTLATQAGIILSGLIGCLTRDETVAWADQAIAARASAPPWLINIPMTRDMRPTDLLKLLSAAAQGGDDRHLAPMAFWRRAIELGRITPQDACGHAASIGLPVGPRKKALRLSRAHDNAADGSAKVEITEAMRAFFEHYGRKSNHSAFIDALFGKP